MCVLRPELSHLPFDLVIYVNGKFLRVQVKTTGYLHKKKDRNPVYRIKTVTRKGIHYRETCDFIVIYVPPMSAWFILPMSKITGNHVKIAKNPEGRMAECRDRWDYLGYIAPEPVSVKNPLTGQLDFFSAP